MDTSCIRRFRSDDAQRADASDAGTASAGAATSAAVPFEPVEAPSPVAEAQGPHWSSENEYRTLAAFFTEYARRNRGRAGVVHGDPVFTNIMLEGYSPDDFKAGRNPLGPREVAPRLGREVPPQELSLKLVDMRGSLGDNQITIRGDIFYDYGKVYQSLLGYDRILALPYHKLVQFDVRSDLDDSASRRAENLAAFERFFLSRYSAFELIAVKFVAKLLLFTLIPLHDTEELEQADDERRRTVRLRCQRWFELGVALDPYESVWSGGVSVATRRLPSSAYGGSNAPVALDPPYADEGGSKGVEEKSPRRRAHGRLDEEEENEGPGEQEGGRRGVISPPHPYSSVERRRE